MYWKDRFLEVSVHVHAYKRRYLRCQFSTHHYVANFLWQQSPAGMEEGGPQRAIINTVQCPQTGGRHGQQSSESCPVFSVTNMVHSSAQYEGVRTRSLKPNGILKETQFQIHQGGKKVPTDTVMTSLQTPYLKNKNQHTLHPIKMSLWTPAWSPPICLTPLGPYASQAEGRGWKGVHYPQPQGVQEPSPLSHSDKFMRHDRQCHMSFLVD